MNSHLGILWTFINFCVLVHSLNMDVPPSISKDSTGQLICDDDWLAGVNPLAGQFALANWIGSDTGLCYRLDNIPNSSWTKDESQYGCYVWNNTV